MSWLLTDEEFRGARAAARAGTITSELYAFLQRLVAAHVRQRLAAAAASPTGRWDDEAVQETVHEWLADRLLPGGLRSAFDATAYPKALSRYLEEAFRTHLASKARARGGPRLLVRARRLLGSNDRYERFQSGSSWRSDWWGLSDWENPQPYQGDDTTLVQMTFALGDFAIVRHSAASEREDPVISSADLDRLLTGLMTSTAALLTLDHFDMVLKERFAFAYAGATVDLAAVEEPSTDELQPGEKLRIEESAREILAEVSERQLAILRDKLREGLTLEQLAARHEVSRGTADNELRRVDAVARAHTLDDERFDEILEMVVDLASSEGGQP